MFLPNDLVARVRSRFEHAQATGSLTFSYTDLATIHSKQGIPFLLRYCPALSRKPQKNDKSKTSTITIDPFENPEVDLLIVEIPVFSDSATHILVLNKYPVIRNHFILATKHFKLQTDPLEESDVALTHACLTAWEQGEDHGEVTSSRTGERRLFAFFNSGEHSGASQPHRHLQFLPVEDMEDGSKQNDWQLLIDLMLESAESIEDFEGEVLSNPRIPFVHFVRRLSPSATPAQLFSAYQSLYSAASRAVGSSTQRPVGSGQTSSFRKAEGRRSEPQSSTFSYNLAMTTSAMAICPRQSEGLAFIHATNGNSEKSFVALNGTLLGGTLMVKDARDWEALRQQPQRVEDLVAAIGVAKLGSTQSANAGRRI